MRRRPEHSSAAKAISLCVVTLQVPSLSITMQTSSFPNLSQAASTTSADLKMSGDYLHCIFTAEANLNPSMTPNTVLRPFIVGQ